MKAFFGWLSTHQTEFLIATIVFVGILVAVLELVRRAWENRRNQPPDDKIQRVLELYGDITDWLDGVGGVDILDAGAAVQGLIRLLSEIDLPGASKAYSRAIRAEYEIFQAHQMLEDLITALDSVLEETEEPAWGRTAASASGPAPAEAKTQEGVKCGTGWW